jgi:hypothetical protein
MSDFDFDFGFSAVTEDELKVVQEASKQAETATQSTLMLEQKINSLYNMIMPLLNNLAKNPEKDYIYWPNRLDKIEQFRDKLDEVYKT